MNAEDSNTLFEWGGDPLSAGINKQIELMPDRPKVILALIKKGREFDGQIEQAFEDMPNNYLKTFLISVLSIPYRVCRYATRNYEDGFKNLG
jgi:hypothetical protein